MKILLVEDDTWHRDTLSKNLICQGYDVVCAQNGAEAIDLTSSESPNLILMSLTLPVIGAWKVIRRIKTHPNLKHIPIITLTTPKTAEEQQKALDAGSNDFIEKPIQWEHLIKKIESYHRALKCCLVV